ncbi:hypothetical protein KUTeg_006171 [Tegillarca granosa]|uniref:Uncharacterized protein n=1 Tax=Tegillarca granosa TaxID=220873 RepID=A0ABQ9FI05_TEGGR|nr:hypothetical protein KUTeg_006171 [Tegillarca granosa]
MALTKMLSKNHSALLISIIGISNTVARALAGFLTDVLRSTVALRTIVLTEHLGIDLLTHAFGIVAMFQGVAFSVVPPLAGMLFDFTGAYIYPFVMVGGMYFVAGVICLPLLLSSTRLLSEEVIKIEITEDSSVDVSIVSDDEDTEFTVKLYGVQENYIVFYQTFYIKSEMSLKIFSFGITYQKCSKQMIFVKQ